MLTANSQRRIAERIAAQLAKADERAYRRAVLVGALVVEEVQRMKIAERDGQECYLCGAYLCWYEITLDHVVPLSLGGHHTYANCKLACATCNSKKAARLLSEISRAEF